MNFLFYFFVALGTQELSGLSSIDVNSSNGQRIGFNGFKKKLMYLYFATHGV